jgi:hypothetical protein
VPRQNERQRLMLKARFWQIAPILRHHLACRGRRISQPQSSACHHRCSTFERQQRQERQQKRLTGEQQPPGEKGAFRGPAPSQALKQSQCHCHLVDVLQRAVESHRSTRVCFDSLNTSMGRAQKWPCSPSPSSMASRCHVPWMAFGGPYVSVMPRRLDEASQCCVANYCSGLPVRSLIVILLPAGNEYRVDIDGEPQRGRQSEPTFLEEEKDVG